MDASKCLPGKEQWEAYYSVVLDRELIQYDYRAPDGELFSTVAPTLEKARIRRDAWLASRGSGKKK